MASHNSCHPHVLFNPGSYSVPAVLSVAVAWGAGVRENGRLYSKDGSWELPQGFLVPDQWTSLTTVSREQLMHSAGLPGCWGEGALHHWGIGVGLVECCRGERRQVL